jgi:DNA-directed RNA polymerase subunit F
MLAKVFKELAEQRYLDFKEASEMLNKEFEDKTDDIRDEKKKTNKFWKIHRAVYSKKFRLLVEDMVKPKNNFEMMR